jgi:hypothetical protein
MPNFTISQATRLAVIALMGWAIRHVWKAVSKSWQPRAMPRPVEPNLTEDKREYTRRTEMREFAGLPGWRGDVYSLRLVTLSGGGYRAALYHAGVLRALYDSGFLTADDSSRVQVIVNAVSGGSIPAVLWDQVINVCPGVLDADPLWPERAVLRLVESSPTYGERFNWLIRRIHPSLSWRAFLHNWWESVTLELRDSISTEGNWVSFLLAAGGLTTFLVETLDFLTGDVFVFCQGRLSLPDNSFYKDGQTDGWDESSLVRLSVPDALSAATGFAVYFPALALNIRRFAGITGPIELMDAGLIDNLGLLPFAPLIE